LCNGGTLVKIGAMPQWLRYIRWFLRAVLTLYLAAPIFGVRPPDTNIPLNVLFDGEEWITNHTPDPILYGLLAGLFIALVSPELGSLMRRLAGAGNTATLTITRALVSKSGTGLPLLSIGFSISNHGPPTTFHNWELWIRPPRSKSVGIKMEGRLGLGAASDVLSDPLRTGGTWHATYDTTHYALPYDAMLESGTVFTIRTLDSKGREITARHTFHRPPCWSRRPLRPISD
jgi:hypothetical protein